MWNQEQSTKSGMGRNREWSTEWSFIFIFKKILSGFRVQDRNQKRRIIEIGLPSGTENEVSCRYLDTRVPSEWSTGFINSLTPKHMRAPKRCRHCRIAAALRTPLQRSLAGTHNGGQCICACITQSPWLQLSKHTNQDSICVPQSCSAVQRRRYDEPVHGLCTL